MILENKKMVLPVAQREEISQATSVEASQPIIVGLARTLQISSHKVKFTKIESSLKIRMLSK